MTGITRLVVARLFEMPHGTEASASATGRID